MGRASGEGIDFPPTKAPGSQGKDNGIGFDWLGGNDPFIMRADGKAWLFAPSGLVDGPLPTHYEPYESPVHNIVYKQQSNPVAKVWNVEGNPYHQVADPKYPIVDLDLSPDRALSERDDEPLAAVAGGIDARAVLRDFARACSGKGHQERRVYDDRRRRAEKSRRARW